MENEMKIAAVLGSALFGCGVLFATNPGSAAPTVPTKVTASGVASVEKVGWRPYRHCHWRRGYRHCHGGRYYRRYGGPGVSLYIGPGRRWGHRNRYWGRRW